MGRTLVSADELLDPEAARAEPGSLLLEDGRIVAKIARADRVPDDARRVELRGLALAPGFVDLHHHGRVIFYDAARLEEGLLYDASFLVRHGTTAFLATTVSLGPAELADAVEDLALRIAHWRPPGAAASPIGIHLEGPWISSGASGAHSPSGIRPFERSEGEALIARASGAIRMVTLAPELPGASALLDLLARCDAVAALGHSLASADVVTQSMTQGARHVTHLFNAMGPLHHRAPGLAGVALAEGGLTCDLICDGAHVDPRMLAVAVRCARERLVMITDRLDPPGADSGPLRAGRLRDDGTALRLEDGRLAGSRLDLATAVANARRLAGMTRLEAIAAVTLRPASVIGVESERWSFRRGARADLVALDAQDRVVETWIGGERVYRAPPP